MGWDIDLLSNGQPVQVAPHQTGSVLEARVENGEVVAIDSVAATCCITFNYSRLYDLAGFYMRDMSGKKASETVESLQEAVKKLGTDRDKNYWKDTPGNAGAALETLLRWAKQHPDAEWHVC